MNKRTPVKVRTRFAPSPTGPLHIGGVRTALYAYLYARHHGGDFLLRIEDTDRNRFVPGAEEYIVEALAWCGIKIDEGIPVGGAHAPYRQSERKEIYKEYADRLVQSGHAYYAFDTAEELEAVRKEAEAKGSSFLYSAVNREKMKNSLSLTKEETARKIATGEHYVIRLRVPAGEEVKFSDLIRGDVSVHSSVVDDKVLLKSDGMPTYHLAHIVDDYLMEITHVIRGEEWLPSAPAHVLIYRYLGLEDVMPSLAHLPLLLRPDGKGKLSKRDGDRLGIPVFPLEWKDPQSGEVSSGYREKGFYPEAFVNMLAFLGWNPGTEQEMFTMDELAAQFTFEHVHKGGARFDAEKAIWFNEQWLRRKPDAVLAARLKADAQKEFALDINDRRLGGAFLLKAVQLLKERVQFEQELVAKGRYLFLPPEQYDEQVLAKKWKPGMEEFFGALCSELQELPSYAAADIETMFKETAAKHNLKPGDVLQLFRVVLSGLGAGVDLFPMAELLGREEAVHRITMAMKKISG